LLLSPHNCESIQKKTERINLHSISGRYARGKAEIAAHNMDPGYLRCGEAGTVPECLWRKDPPYTRLEATFFDEAGKPPERGGCSSLKRVLCLNHTKV